jgi:5-methylcytosine-specific restriction endonuclease McrA
LLKNWRANRRARRWNFYNPVAMDLDAVRCWRCGKLLTLVEMTVDRIIPGCRGGRYTRDNIRPACARCNSETGGAVRAK